MKFLSILTGYFSSTAVLVAGTNGDCKCTPESHCWPSTSSWESLNRTVGGALIRGVPPGSVCYPDQPDYSESACEIVRSQWYNSTWHADDPISIDYPVWTNNSCNPIWPNGTSINGDVNAGNRGCQYGNYPVYVVNATTPKQVGEALKWAGKKNVRIIVKSTGHSYPGRSIGYGSLSIWTHHFRGIEYIPSFKPTNCPINGTMTAARVAAGVTGAEAQTEMAKYKSIVVTGANPDVGLMGWMTGGGHGPLSSTYGMGADNLLEATIVTPDGEVHLANPCQNTDLFFAIRGGGGGTYGVVTEAVIKTYPTPNAHLLSLQFAALSPNITTEFWDLIGWFHVEFARFKEEGVQGIVYILGPPLHPSLAARTGFFLYDRPNGTMQTLFAPVEEKLKSLSHLFVVQTVYRSADTYLELYGPAVSNEPVANAGSAYVLAQIGSSNDAKKPNGPFANPMVLSHFFAPPTNKTPSYYPETISMNPAWRNTLSHMIVVENWPEGVAQAGIDAVYTDITVNKMQPLKDLSPETGAYFNEADSYEPEWQTAFWGENYGRLLGIKRNVDPENVLWCRRCVGSEALVEQINGRLCKA